MTLLSGDAEAQYIQAQMSATLNQFSTELWQKRERVLHLWHSNVQNDDTLDIDKEISWSQFRDHMPDILRLLCDRWSKWPAIGEIGEREHDTAVAHSHYRWQQNYNLRDMVREWGHFNMALLEVIDGIILDLTVTLADDNQNLDHNATAPAAPLHAAALHPGAGVRSARTWRLESAGCLARAMAAQMLTESMSGSITHYSELMQGEAALRGRELEAILESLHAEERERTLMLRDAAHDVRGSLVIVTGSASIIDREALQGNDRAQVHRLLQTGVRSLQDMMTDLIDLARLEAGEEELHLDTFDAARTLRELCETVRPLTHSKHLELRYDGDSEQVLKVQGDETKVRRIVQNLLLNAIYYTPKGHISLQWADYDDEHWVITVQDSGPGFPSIAPVSADGHAGIDGHAGVEDFGRPRSEGIGLAIVRRLCALLHAQIQIDSQPGAGSTFRIIMPRQYEEAEDQRTKAKSAENATR